MGEYVWLYNVLTLFECVCFVQVRMSHTESHPLNANNSAANKIVHIVSQFFVPMSCTHVPPYTSFITPCDTEEAWAFEQLVSLFPENARAKEDILGRVDTLCEQCSYCVLPSRNLEKTESNFSDPVQIPTESDT